MLNSFFFASTPAIPAGLIVPYIGLASNIPSGWSQFTSADDKAIKGHNTTAGTTSGSTSISGVTDVAGGHTGTGVNMWISAVAGAVADLRDSSSKGHHDHTVSITHTPAKRKQILMKASQDHQIFPVDTGILSGSVRADLTDVTPTGKFLHGNSGASSSDSAAISSGSTTNAGTHAHNSGIGNGTGTSATGPSYTYSSGDHSHTISSVNVTDNQRKIWLGLYQATIAALPDANTYGLWESATPPPGWDICDGTNGTPNLVNHFIGFDASKIGTVEGNGTVNFTASISSHTTHSHTGSNVTQSLNTGYHSSYAMPNHAGLSQTGLSYEMPSYTLIIVKYKG